MKIRTGFVSNSSASSFLIYGVCIENLGEYPTIIEAYKKENNISEDKEIDKWDIMDFIETKSGLGCRRPYGEEYFIGESWSNIKDEQTGKEFKDSVKKKVKDFFGEEIECYTHEEAWRNETQ